MKHEWLRPDGQPKPDLATKPGAFDRLDAGPWFWPREDQEALMELAEANRPEGRPAPRPGVVPLVTVGDQGPGLWTLERGGRFPLHQRARDAWTTAVSAVPRCVPLIWTRDCVPRAEELVARRVHGRGEYLDGGSFGVAFAFAAVSCNLELTVPHDLIASAALNVNGVLQPVEGLEQKIQVVATNAPTVCRFIVCCEQSQLAEAAASPFTHLKVIPCTTLTEALTIAFGDFLEPAATASLNSGQRERFIENTFRLALGRRDNVAEWDPVIQAAGCALEWELSDQLRRKLEFARAIAERHQENRGDLPLPPDQWFQTLRQPLRLNAVAHTVQQSADTGVPTPGDALRLAERHLTQGRGSEAFPPHLRLLGAYGRLLYIVGEHKAAYEIEREAITEWLERWEWTEVSYPLSFAYLIAAALGDANAYEQLTDLDAHWRQLAGASPPGAAYVELARGRAAVECKRAKASERLLRPLVASPDLPGHVVGSAKFWLGRALLLQDQEEEAEAIWNELEESTDPLGSMARDVCAIHRRTDAGAMQRLMAKQFIARQIRDQTEEAGRSVPEALVRYLPY